MDLYTEAQLNAESVVLVEIEENLNLPPGFARAVTNKIVLALSDRNLI